MSYQNIRKAKAIEQQNKQRFLEVNPKLDDESGIYFLTREDENGFRYAYIGQAVHILTRLAQHLVNYQHIDLSLKKHGLYAEDNPYGWKVNFRHYPDTLIDKMEQLWIKQYADKGYQLRNKTSGSQGEGKSQIADYRPQKGYRDGLKQGRINLARELSSIAEKHLKIEIRDDKRNNKISQRQFEKFKELLSENNQMKYVASCSFGKDSIATILLAREHNEPLDEIVYCEVMFDKNISGELPEHRDFIYKRAIPLFESWGYKVTVLHSKKTYSDCFYHVATKGKRIGRMLGFPMAGKCMINRDCKVKPINDYWKHQKKDVVQYIGIAIDEPKRLDRIANTENKVSLLEKYEYTEEMAKQKCIEYGLLSPIYSFTNRGGCWFCPNARDMELRHLRKNHKTLWNKLIEMENEPDLIGHKWNALTGVSIHDKEEQFYLEEQQMTIFDYMEEN